MNPQIFREYDVRGRVDEDLTPEVVGNLGRGYAVMMIKEKGISNPKIALGRDCRLSSDRLRDNRLPRRRYRGLPHTDALFRPFQPGRRWRADDHGQP